MKSSGIFCEYCEEELSEEKGELAHGCLRCHMDPLVDKIREMQKEIKCLKKFRNEAVEILKPFSGRDGYKEVNEFLFSNGEIL